jgi:hypothetical protein
MEKWKQDLLEELEKLGEEKVRQRMMHLEYRDPTSPRYEIVKNWLDQQPNQKVTSPKTKHWYEKPYGIIFLGVTASLLATAIWYFFVRQ